MAKTFKQFITESSDPVAQLKSDCVKYLGLVEDDKPLIRGIKGLSRATLVGEIPLTMSPGKADGYSARIYKQKVRKDRVSHGTDNDLSIKYDKWFKGKFGVAARSESLFVIKQPSLRAYDYGMAKIYGTPTYIFPIGDFSYYWSPKIDDLYTRSRLDGLSPQSAVNKYLDTVGYTDDGYDQIPTDHEIMIDCDEYYSVVLWDGHDITKPTDHAEVMADALRQIFA